jgi:hypothetical protein
MKSTGWCQNGFNVQGGHLPGGGHQRVPGARARGGNRHFRVSAMLSQYHWNQVKARVARLVLRGRLKDSEVCEHISV